MNKIAVIYKSKYGSTKKYAQWIAEEAKVNLFEYSEMDVKELVEYDNTFISIFDKPELA